jgi:hypothetical protein
MAKYRSHSMEFKRQVAQEFLSGETLHGLGCCSIALPPAPVQQALRRLEASVNDINPIVLKC